MKNKFIIYTHICIFFALKLIKNVPNQTAELKIFHDFLRMIWLMVPVYVTVNVSENSLTLLRPSSLYYICALNGLVYILYFGVEMSVKSSAK